MGVGTHACGHVLIRVFVHILEMSAMADVSLAAMAGITAADHERISKSYPIETRVWA